MNLTPSELLRIVIQPKRVAVVGASEDMRKFAGKVTANILRSSWADDSSVYLVNPNRETVMGRSTVGTIDELPRGIEHVYLTLPPHMIADQLERADKARIPVATVFTSGFLDTNDVWAHSRLVEIIDRLNIRVLGPNCNGVINVRGGFAATSSSVPYAELVSGSIAIVSHSGGLGQVFGLHAASQRGIGVAFQVSCGNAIDVNEAELASAALMDPGVRVVLCILDRITDGVRLLQAARSARDMDKLVIVVKLGQSAAGQEAVLGHTGQILGNDGVARTLLKENGALVFDDIDLALAAADLWSKYPGFCSDRIASASISGGGLAYFADACGVQQLHHPRLREETQSKLRQLLPSLATVANPVDLSGASDADPVVRGSHAEITKPKSLLPGIISVIAEDDIDVIVVMLTLPPEYDLEALQEMNRADFGNKPVIVLWAGGSRGSEIDVAQMRRSGLVVFESPVTAAAILAEFRSVQQGPPMAPAAGRPWLIERARGSLVSLGVSFPPGKFARNEKEARRSAESIGYPVVMKTAAANVIHKAVLGGVALNLSNSDQVSEAYNSISRTMDDRGFSNSAQVLIEGMVSIDCEFLVSVISDEAFGPVLAFALGGARASRGATMESVALTLATDADLVDTVTRLTGVENGAQVQSIVVTIRRIAEMIVANPGVAMVEINPLVVSGAAVMALDCVVIEHADA